ncbi:MAG TPA: glutathione peroxidase [Hanamia sp.]|jgi:glutathione peroxidase|nr:glutathione peroxidase [Hanamia sp.]
MMRIFRKIINATYPLRMGISKLTGMGIRIYKNEKKASAKESFYSLKAMLITGEEIQFDRYKNKKVLIVNLASECGFTPQYGQLEKLYKEGEELVVLGFPANNFGKQEPGTDVEINNFCKINYGVTFPVFKKNDVKGNSKQTVYQWLTDKNKNGWNDIEPEWNFYKYLVDENGNLSEVSSSSVSPLNISF